MFYVLVNVVKCAAVHLGPDVLVNEIITLSEVFPGYMHFKLK